jgi:hypothetical protein
MKSSGVSIELKGEGIIDKIKEGANPIYDCGSRTRQYLDFSIAFSQLSERLKFLSEESRKQGDRMTP